MTKTTEFSFDAEHAPTVSLALFIVATQILGEYCEDKGNGPWFDDLRRRAISAVKNQDFTGLPAEQEASHVESALAAVNGIFDNIARD